MIEREVIYDFKKKMADSCRGFLKVGHIITRIAYSVLPFTDMKEDNDLALFAAKHRGLLPIAAAAPEALVRIAKTATNYVELDAVCRELLVVETRILKAFLSQQLLQRK